MSNRIQTANIAFKEGNVLEGAPLFFDKEKRELFIIHKAPQIDEEDCATVELLEIYTPKMEVYIYKIQLLGYEEIMDFLQNVTDKETVADRYYKRHNYFEEIVVINMAEYAMPCPNGDCIASISYDNFLAMYTDDFFRWCTQSVGINGQIERFLPFIDPVDLYGYIKG
jgi:hypothetical protein